MQSWIEPIFSVGFHGYGEIIRSVFIDYHYLHFL